MNQSSINQSSLFLYPFYQSCALCNFKLYVPCHVRRHHQYRTCLTSTIGEYWYTRSISCHGRINDCGSERDPGYSTTNRLRPLDKFFTGNRNSNSNRNVDLALSRADAGVPKLPPRIDDAGDYRVLGQDLGCHRNRDGRVLAPRLGPSGVGLVQGTAPLLCLVRSQGGHYWCL